MAEFLKKKDKEKIRLTLKSVEEGQREVNKALGNIWLSIWYTKFKRDIKTYLLAKELL